MRKSAKYTLIIFGVLILLPFGIYWYKLLHIPQGEIFGIDLATCEKSKHEIVFPSNNSVDKIFDPDISLWVEVLGVTSSTCIIQTSSHDRFNASGAICTVPIKEGFAKFSIIELRSGNFMEREVRSNVDSYCKTTFIT